MQDYLEDVAGTETLPPCGDTPATSGEIEGTDCGAT